MEYKELENEIQIEKEDSKIKYNKLRLTLDNHKNKKTKVMKINVIFCVLLFLLISVFAYDEYGFSMEWFFFTIVMAAMAILILNAYIYLLFEIKENSIRKQMIEYEARYTQEETKDDIFENSIQMSYKYLDQYYSQTREQAHNGFVITVIVSIGGAFLIGVGVLAMFIGKTIPSYVISASGVITEFISAIFFYLYNKTVLSMSNYHDKLVLSHNISIALKVSESLPSEDRAKAKNKIIDELLMDINSYLIRSDSYNKNSDK